MFVTKALTWSGMIGSVGLFAAELSPDLDLTELIGTYGLAVVLVVFFVWRDYYGIG